MYDKGILTFASVSLRLTSLTFIDMSFHLINLASKGGGICSPASKYGLQASQTSELAGISLAFFAFGFPRSQTY